MSVPNPADGIAIETNIHLPPTTYHLRMSLLDKYGNCYRWVGILSKQKYSNLIFLTHLILILDAIPSYLLFHETVKGKRLIFLKKSHK